MIQRPSSTIQNSRDQEILEALALRVRLFSLEQIAVAYFEGDVKSTRRRMARLTDSHLVKRLRILARKTPRLEKPIFEWAPAQPQPYYQSIVVQLRRRWLLSPTRMTTVFLPGPATARLFGVKALGKLRHTFQASHDLGFAETFLLFSKLRPTEAASWIKEDIPSKATGQIPDGLIIDSSGLPIRAIEYCGLYSVKRLMRFHNHCAKVRLPYEVW